MTSRSEKRHLPTLSSSALLLECQYWVGAKEYDRSLTGHDQKASSDGTLFHDAIHEFIHCGMKDDWKWPETLSPQIRQWLEYAREWLIVHSQAGWMIQSEVAFEVRLSTGNANAIKLDGSREYPYRDGHVYGTADVILTKGDESIVADWKTGGTDAAEAQLQSLGYAWRLSRQKPMAPDPQLQTWKVTDEGVWAIEYKYDFHHWSFMTVAYEDVLDKKNNTPVPGIHCTQLYCPHLAHCKAYDPAVVVMAQQEGKAPVELTESPKSDLEAGEVMALVTAIKRRVKYFENAMKAYSLKGGCIRVGDYEYSQKKDGFRWRKSK